MLKKVEISEVIEKWLSQFDSVLEQFAADPVMVRRDDFLYDLFKLAYPPEGLPRKIPFREGAESYNFDEISAKHHPYYAAARRETTRTNAAGETSKKVEIVLKLNNSEPFRRMLADRGFIKRGK